MSTTNPRVKSKEHVYDSLIVGAGISGLCAAIKMKKNGYTDFKIIEKAERVGGTWRDNTYPGCGCDVPSSLYSFSFAPSSKWSHLFARQPEILSYLEEVGKDYGISELIDFGTELENAQWNEEEGFWVIDTLVGERREITYARTVVFATGPITEPQIPALPGLETFEGEMFHSANWNHEYDLTKKRVAVIGTGASAIQFVPQIQPKVKKLHVFQRTAPWVLPKPDLDLARISHRSPASLANCAGYRHDRSLAVVTG